MYVPINWNKKQIPGQILGHPLQIQNDFSMIDLSL